MEKIKKNLHSWNNHVFLGFSFVVFSIIFSVYWGLTYAADTLPLSTSGTTLSTDGTIIDPSLTATSGTGTLSGGATSSGTPNYTTLPKAPTELSLYYITELTPTMTYIPLKWKDNDMANLNKFFLLQRNTTGHDDLITLTRIYTTTVSNTNTTGLYYYKDTKELTKELVPGISYDYQVKACVTETICSDSSYFRNVSIPLPKEDNTPVPPDAPTDLIQKIVYTTTTTATTKTVTPSIELSWTDKSSTETKFLINRKLSTEATYPTSSSLYRYTNANITTFTDRTVYPEHSYDYSIQACATETLCSSALEVKGILVPKAINTTTDPLIENPDLIKAKPPIVTDLRKDSAYSNDTSSYIIIKWLYNYTNDVKFNIGRKTAGLSTSAYTNIGFTLKGNNVYKDATVEPGVPYDYGVSACSLENACSDYVELKNVSSPSLVVKAPTTPSLITSEINNTVVGYPTVTLKWKDNATNEDRYVIERRSSLNSTYIKLSDELRPGTINFLDKIEPGIYYEYRIKACYLTTCSSYLSLPTKVFVAKVQTAEPIKETESATTAPVLKIEPIAETKTTTPVTTKTTVPVATNTETSINTKESNVVVEKEENSGDLLAVNIEEVLNILSGTDRTNIDKINEESELIYKDTNNDGISDYDSKYIYNIDPSKSSPTSLYEGKNINASEKILLGYDPTKTELVKIEKEEPALSKASIVDTYKVKKMELTEKKDILIKGQALPNSYITLYIYSTPIMVTVKTDNKGEWQYVLDKELEDGEHTVYTATVNNTGNIVAKSSPYLFTKTAEAVTLRDIPVAEASSVVAKPGLVESKGIYIIILGLLMSIGITLILVGLFTKKETQVIG